MTTSPTGRRIIEGFEALRTKAYQDQRGIWTNGYGHTADVHEGDICTEAQADTWMVEDLKVAEDAVNSGVRVPINQNQFDALVSLTYNIGATAFAHSTLLSLLNQKAYQGAANQFLAWDKTNGVVNNGLVRRRGKERALFMSLPNGDHV